MFRGGFAQVGDFQGWFLAYMPQLTVLFCTGCGSPPQPVAPQQSGTNVSFAASSRFADLGVCYQNGATGQNAIIESLGGGVGLLDYDRDGWLDVCLPGGGVVEQNRITGSPTCLVRQSGLDQFVRVEHFAGLKGAHSLTHGCAVADYDNDGFPDVLISGYAGVVLWRNLGDGRFQDVTVDAGLTDPRWTSSAAWGDINGDGVLDLYLVRYVDWSFSHHPLCRGPSGVPDVCPPRQFDGVDDCLLFGTGRGDFVDVSQHAGLLPGGKGLAAVMADFDDDGDLDIYVANDTTPNAYYRNDGVGALVENGLVAGVALDDMANANGSMGIALFSARNAGAPDIWVTNYEDELFALYQNDGQGAFHYKSRKAGLNRLGQLYVGFGCVSGDFDADGDEDVAVANGHVVYHPVNAPILQEPLLMLDTGGEVFERWRCPPTSYFAERHLGRGVATGDLNQDGLLDLVFVNSDSKTVLLNNTSSSVTHTGARRTTLTVRPVGTISPRDGIGVRAVLVTSQRQIGRQLFGGGSYLSTSDLRLHWGLNPSETIKELRVVWPTGRQTTVTAGEISSLLVKSAGEMIVRE